MIFSKPTKKLIFKYKHIVLLLLVTLFLVFYNNPYKETFDINQCTSGEVLDERTTLYCNAADQITTDVKTVAFELIRDKCYENVDRCMTFLTEMLTPPAEPQ